MADYTNRVSPHFAEFLLEHAHTGVDILALLDDFVEVDDTAPEIITTVMSIS